MRRAYSLDCVEVDEGVRLRFAGSGGRRALGARDGDRVRVTVDGRTWVGVYERGSIHVDADYSAFENTDSVRLRREATCG